MYVLKREVLNPRTANNVITEDFVSHPSFRRELVYFRNYDAFFYWTENRYFKKLDNFEIKKLFLNLSKLIIPIKD